MENVGYAALQVIPTFKGIDSSLERGTAGAMAGAGKQGGVRFGDAAGKSAATGMRNHLKSAAAFIIGGFVGAEAIRKTGDIIRDSLSEARDSQRVSAVTEARIKSTGKAAGLTAKQVGQLSTALSNKVGIDDETIQRGANMLLTFKNIRDGLGKQNKVFTEATAVTTDLAASMSGGNGGEPDLKSASILVGKALNDPIKGLTALTRVGVSFDDQQKKQIENFIKQGDAAKAQKIILAELNSEFGGTAAAQATVSEKLTVAWKNTEEELGNKLLPLVHDFQRFLLKEGVPAARDFVKWFGKEGAPEIERFVDSAKPLANSILPAVGTGLKDVAGFMKDAAPKAKAVFDAFNSLPDWAQKSIVIGGAAGLVAKKSGALSLGSKALTGGGTTGGGILGLVSKEKPVPVFVVNGGAGGLDGVPGGAGGGSGKLGTLEKFKRSVPLYSAQGLLVGAIAVEGAEGVNRGVGNIGSFFKSMTPGASTTAGADASSKVRFALPPVDAGGLTVQQYLKSLRPAAKDADVLRGNLGNLSTSLDILRHGTSHAGESFDDLAAKSGKYGALLAKLPTKVETAILTPGMVKTQGDVAALRRKYDLTPRQVSTVFELTGIDRARRQIDQLRAHAGRHISAELSIELADRSPQQQALDGVRRP